MTPILLHIVTTVARAKSGAVSLRCSTLEWRAVRPLVFGSADTLRLGAVILNLIMTRGLGGLGFFNPDIN
jgi:hypothetical protein